MKSVEELQAIRRQALGPEPGGEPADLVIKNARILNVITGEIIKGDIAVCGDRIVGIYGPYHGKREIDAEGLYATPGLIDRHVHVDSSGMNGYLYDEAVLMHGTTTAFWCPHEIANVIGAAGIEYARQVAAATVMDLRVQRSSSVPALPPEMETAGAEIDAATLRRFKGLPHIHGTGELMSKGYILSGDPDYMQKIHDGQGEVLSGHEPLERGYRLQTSAALGIGDDHETTGYDEGLEKLRIGMALLIRKGTQCDNLKDLYRLINDRTAPRIALCTDDKKLNDDGYIDAAVREGIRLGVPVATMYRVATLSGAETAGVRDLGFIGPGYRADILLLDDLEECRVRHVIKSGRLVTTEMFAARQMVPAPAHNSVKLRRDVRPDDFALKGNGRGVDIIGMIQGQIVTDHLREDLLVDARGVLLADPARDILKIAMIERHGRSANGNIGVSFVKGFGFWDGAVAFTVSHDAHNLGVIGANDADMALAANRAKDIQGGFVVVQGGRVIGELPLPIGGLMVEHGTTQAQMKAQLAQLFAAVEQLQPAMGADKVFLAASFAPLGVIPAMGVSDCGPIIFDVLKGDKAPRLAQDQRGMLGLGRTELLED